MSRSSAKRRAASRPHGRDATPPEPGSPRPIPTSPERRIALGRATALIAILALAAGIRIVACPPVYTADGVRFGPDSDPYYHVLRARELAVRGEVVWTDPGMNHPLGADVLWPPGFDALVASVAWVTAWGRPTDAWVERVAPAVPVALGVASVLLVALLGAELFGGRLALGPALMLSFIQPHLQYTSLNRPDQHAAEIALFTGIMLLFARALRPASVAASLWASAGAGLLLALAFWTWPGSAVIPLVLGGFAALRHVAARAGEALDGVAWSVAVMGVTASGVLGVSIAVLGPPGALSRGSLAGISGLAAALCFALGGFGAVLALARRRPAGCVRRVLEVAFAGAVPLAILAALPGTREGIGHGLAALLASNAWYESVREYQPLVGGMFAPLRMELGALLLKFGLAPLAVVAAVPVVLRLFKGEPARSARLAWLLWTGGILLALTLARHRFELYLAIPIALLAPVGIGWFAGRFSARARVALAGGWLVAVAPMVAALPTLTVPDPLREALIQLATQLGQVHEGEPRGVLAQWDRGHYIRYYSGLPVVTTPFGTDLGADALDDAARFWLAGSENDAQEVLARRRVRWLVLEQPEPEVALGEGLLGRSGLVVETEVTADGRGIHLTAQGQSLVSARLYYGDGSRFRDLPPLTGFRLVQEVAGPELPSLKVFEVVRGATMHVVGAAPGDRVEVSAEIATPDARRFTYAAEAGADASGRATLRLPYATGPNGAVGATPYAIRSGGRSTFAQISDAAVRRGLEVVVRLP